MEIPNGASHMPFGDGDRMDVYTALLDVGRIGAYALALYLSLNIGLSINLFTYGYWLKVVAL